MPQTFEWPIHSVPKVLNAGRFPLDDQNFSNNYLARARHAFHLYDYSGSLRLGGDEFAIDPGSCSITPTGVAARYHLDRPGTHYCVHFRSDDVLPTDAERVSLPLFFDLKAMRESVALQIIEIAKSLVPSRTDPIAAALMSHRFQSLILWIASILKTPNRIEGDRVHPVADRAARIIEGNLEEDLPAPRLARRVGLSQNYLARVFKESYGMTMSRYVLTRRIEHAKTLLSISDLNVGEIGAKVGFPDPQYFNKRFRKTVGISPKKFRDAATRE